MKASVCFTQQQRSLRSCPHLRVLAANQIPPTLPQSSTPWNRARTLQGCRVRWESPIPNPVKPPPAPPSPTAGIPADRVVPRFVGALSEMLDNEEIINPLETFPAAL